ncbi:MAG: Ig-like domain-containing protein [Planctomycetota bacterium]|nr:Ig-like domain-containing protein [Planctomycetota bacterium]
MQIRKAPDLITASVLLLAAGLLPACNSNSDEPFGADGNAGFLAPTAEDDLAMTLEETPVSIDVLANDLTNGESIDPDSVQVVQSVVHGILVPVGGGVFTYTPDTDYYNQQASQGELFAPDTFTYTVASVGGSVSDEATVSITVNDVNDGPLAGDD